MPGRIMDEELRTRIEKLDREEFRATVNIDRRATLAIGALVLSFGQLDTAMGWIVRELREEHTQQGFDGRPQNFPSGILELIKLLRVFLRDLRSDEDVKTLDRLRTSVDAPVRMRDDVVHGALAYSFKWEEPDSEYILCMPHRRVARGKDGQFHQPGGVEMIEHKMSAVFSAADTLRSAREDFEKLCRARPLPTH